MGTVTWAGSLKTLRAAPAVSARGLSTKMYGFMKRAAAPVARVSRIELNGRRDSVPMFENGTSDATRSISAIPESRWRHHPEATGLAHGRVHWTSTGIGGGHVLRWQHEKAHRLAAPYRSGYTVHGERRGREGHEPGYSNRDG